MEDDKNFYLMFGRLEGKVDTLLSQHGGMNKRLDDHDTRITNLEKLKAQGTGMVTSIRWGWVLIAATLGTFSNEIRSWIFK